MRPLMTDHEDQAERTSIVAGLIASFSSKEALVPGARPSHPERTRSDCPGMSWDVPPTIPWNLRMDRWKASRRTTAQWFWGSVVLCREV